MFNTPGRPWVLTLVYVPLFPMPAFFPVLTSPQLSKASASAPRVLARIARAPGTVLLEVTKEAISEGLLDSCLVATVMLVCGHNID